MRICVSYIIARTSNIIKWDDDDDDDDDVLDQHAYLDFDSGSLLKQQSAGRSVIPLGLFLILSQPVLALTAYYCVLGGEEANTNVIVFGLTTTHDLPHSRRVH